MGERKPAQYRQPTFYAQGDGMDGWDIPCRHCGRMEREHWTLEDGRRQCAISDTASALPLAGGAK